MAAAAAVDVVASAVVAADVAVVAVVADARWASEEVEIKPPSKSVYDRRNEVRR